MPWGPDNEPIQRALRDIPGAKLTPDGAGVTFTLPRLKQERIDQIAELITQRDRAREQRDDLLAACESLLYAITEDRYMRMAYEERIEAAEAAIAKVKGGQG